MRYYASIVPIALTGFCLLLAGCGSNTRSDVSSRAMVSGHAHGGQQPLSGASVQLYAVSSAADGAPSIALLSAPVVSDQSGAFSIDTYTCPAGNPLVYLVALGGNPGFPSGRQNPNAGLMAALGPCSSVQSSTYVEMNELTTIASVWPLAPFMTNYGAVGSRLVEAEQLVNAFAVANQLVNMGTGTVRGTAVPMAATVPQLQLNTLADVIASCINSGGGKSGDGTPCGTLFSLTRNARGIAPTNTIGAALNMAFQPSSNVGALFGLITADNVFGPSLPAVPESWAIPLTDPAPNGTGTFTLQGLVSPATVTQSIFVFSAAVPVGSTVTYFLDDQMASTENSAPYWMGGGSQSNPNGFLLHVPGTGAHTLRAVAQTPSGDTWVSNVVDLNVVPSINDQFSTSLSPYANQISAQQSSSQTLMASVATPAVALSVDEASARQEIFTMYLNWGINPALDFASDQSSVLAGLVPTGWQVSPTSGAGQPLSMWFSPDAPYYQKIPTAWPRVALPSGYFGGFQLNAVTGGDGIGFGEVTAAATDPSLAVRSEWYTDATTLKIFNYRMPSNWSASLPWLTGGDRHMIFVDPNSGTFVSTYKTSVDALSRGPDALYASSPTQFGTLGVAGGSNAAGFADLPVLLQPGEATNKATPIPHALGGPVGRTWAARVFPAFSRDAGVLTSANSCTGVGFTNTGLVPYGGLIQLDPSLDLSALTLSLPAFRILQAMQTYGYYVMDFGCSDLDIYTSISEIEFAAYGGMYGNANGIGVQNEIQKVLLSNKLYVVAPLTKKQ